MKSFKTLSVLILGLSSISKADVIKCNFTEPFINTTYSMAQQTLKIESAGEPTRTIKNVSFQIKGPGLFELQDKNKKVLQSLTLNNNGSDGMSDKVYPFEVTFAELKNMANSGLGGCESNFLKGTEQPEK